MIAQITAAVPGKPTGSIEVFMPETAVSVETDIDALGAWLRPTASTT